MNHQLIADTFNKQFPVNSEVAWCDDKGEMIPTWITLPAHIHHSQPEGTLSIWIHVAMRQQCVPLASVVPCSQTTHPDSRSLKEQRLRAAFDYLTDIIGEWNDCAEDGDRGRANDCLVLTLYDDGSGRVGVAWWDEFEQSDGKMLYHVRKLIAHVQALIQGHNHPEQYDVPGILAEAETGWKEANKAQMAVLDAADNPKGKGISFPRFSINTHIEFANTDQALAHLAPWLDV